MLSGMHTRFVRIIYKGGNAAARELGQRIEKWLELRGLHAELSEAGCEAKLTAKPETIIVLGGDGTILGVARSVAFQNIPILGINFGRVGFLTAFDEEEWETGLGAWLESRLPLRKCLALNWCLLRGGVPIREGVAVNDVVAGRGALARLVTIKTGIDAEPMGSLRSDGIIACTPVGSTAYCASAGGPVMHPELCAIALVPICSFMPRSFPLVVPAKTSITLTVGEDAEEAFLTIDGQLGTPLLRGDEVRIAGSPGAIQFLGSNTHFYSRLRTRGFSFK